MDENSGSEPTEASDLRRPRSVYGVGSEPDPRFTLANERTALSWIRTGLSMIAGGVGLISLSAIADLPALLDVVALVACLAGGLLAVHAMVQWRRAERAMRKGEPLPASSALAVLAIGVGVLATTLIVYSIYILTR